MAGKVLVNLTTGMEDDAFVANARVAGATPMLEWLGDEPGTVFSY